MDEDIAIINSNTRNQRIKDFFTKNKKLLIKTLKNTIKKRDKVLFKGSRSMLMDEIINEVFKF